ncbi:MAG: hypothetical protein V7607_3464 [Solirubrobacteraceae bacterium]
MHGAEVVVAIVFAGERDRFVQCVTSVLRCTATDIPVLVIDDGKPDPASRRWLDDVANAGATHSVLWLRSDDNRGYGRSCQAAFGAAAPADIALIDDDHVVSDGWLDRLAAAARSESLAATAVPLVSDGSMLAVGDASVLRPRVAPDVTLEVAADRLRHLSPKARPRVPLLVGGCAWIKRTALDAVEGFDPALSTGEACRMDFGQRCLAYGLQHVVADDALVGRNPQHRIADAADDWSDDSAERQVEQPPAPLDRVVESRYPYVPQLVARVTQDRHSALRRALVCARAAIQRPSVTIDGRALTASLAGTQVHALELIGALSRTGEVDLRVVVPPDMGEYARASLTEMPEVATVAPDAVGHPTDIVHRPYQVSHPRDLRLLLDWGERLLITNQDLISYRTPTHFGSFEHWIRFRTLTAEAMAVANLVLFFSHHSAQDALAEDIVPSERARVVPIGVDHRLTATEALPSPPKDRGNLADSPYLLVMGSRYRHKNRIFALRLLRALHTRHDWRGRLVFAGAEVRFGSSSPDETAWLAAHPGIAPFVVDVAAVDESEKAWLYEHAAAVVYPSLYEGFGLVPFEAARHGKPCLWAHQSALAEVLPEDGALIVPWDADRSADRAIEVLRSATRARAHVEMVRARAAELTWDGTAARLLDVYREALAVPAREMLHLRDMTITSEASYWGLREGIGATGMSLVDPYAALLPHDTQRALAALARRPTTRRPLLSALRIIGRFGRTGRSDEPPTQRTWLDGTEPPQRR